ncbi:hypothetical protein BDZ91DRAFT_683358 [Kalaharituber pfeilii]|nr:hypothetical protein BDZ91DRAFT_683358 [Kalaharituber pfeilii]
MSSQTYEKAPDAPAVIMLLGVPGSGKSSFFRKMTAQEESERNGSDSGGPEDQMPFREAPTANGRITLVDTPGFDVMQEDDGGPALVELRDWLRKKYQENCLLSGIFWFHRISDDRMTGSNLLALNAFKNLCGQEFWPNVLFVTTRWDMVTEEVGQQRLQQLRQEFWAEMLHHGADVVEWRETSTGQELQIFLEPEHQRPLRLAIQKELVDDRLEWDETNVGQIVIPKELRELRAKERQIAFYKKQLARTLEEGRRMDGQRYALISRSQVGQVGQERYNARGSQQNYRRPGPPADSPLVQKQLENPRAQFGSLTQFFFSFASSVCRILGGSKDSGQLARNSSRGPKGSESAQTTSLRPFPPEMFRGAENTNKYPNDLKEISFMDQVCNGAGFANDGRFPHQRLEETNHNDTSATMNDNQLQQIQPISSQGNRGREADEGDTNTPLGRHEAESGTGAERTTTDGPLRHNGDNCIGDVGSHRPADGEGHRGELAERGDRRDVEEKLPTVCEKKETAVQGTSEWWTSGLTAESPTPEQSEELVDAGNESEISDFVEVGCMDGQ